MEFASVPDLQLLAAASKTYKFLVDKHIVFRRDQMFRAFDLDPRHMLRTLRATGAVVSGSCALLVVMPWSFTPGDMDIYVTRSHAHRLLSILKQEYGLITRVSATQYAGLGGIATIVTLARHGGKKIQVIVSMSRNPIDLITRFHCTAVMNFVSSNGIFSAYPFLTTRNRALLNTHELRPKQKGSVGFGAWLSKYVRRGYDIRANPAGWSKTDGRKLKRAMAVNRDLDDKDGMFYLCEDAEEDRPRSARIYSSGADLCSWSLERNARLRSN